MFQKKKKKEKEKKKFSLFTASIHLEQRNNIAKTALA